MAKRLTIQQRIKRARAEGFSRKQLAQSFGVSVSAVGRAERGDSSGATIEAQVVQFSKLGKRAKQDVASGAVQLPSAPPKRAAKGGRRVTPLRRAEGQLSQYSDDTRVVVHITSKTTGRSRTLYAKGGIDAGDISDNLGGAISAQSQSQYSDDIDWTDVYIDVDEY